MAIFALKRPLSFQWIILGSLVFFSFFPIFLLEIVQIMTIPHQIEQSEIKNSQSELNFTAELIQTSIFDDSEKLALLSSRDSLITYLSNTDNQTNRIKAVQTISDFINLSQLLFSSLPQNYEPHQILEIGLDSIKQFSSENSTDSDRLDRLVTFTYSDASSTFQLSGVQNILNIQNYYPYLEVKSYYNSKQHFSSSIRQYTNFMTGEAIRDLNQNPIPVNVHSRLIQSENGSYIGHIYSIVSASWILDLIDQLSDPKKPAIITNREGTVFYSDKTLVFTEVTGYYKTILEAGFDTISVDHSGYQDEITIYRQIAIDIEKNQTLLIARVLPRNTIFDAFQKALVQGILTLIISTSLATVFAYIVTKSLTLRIQKVTLAAEQISKGDFGVKLDLNGSDELARLSRTFDRMTKSLKVYIKDEE
ncbi:MAG: HAMP domain-containing protein [Candidatus Hodarchaeales archaeon]